LTKTPLDFDPKNHQILTKKPSDFEEKNPLDFDQNFFRF